MGLTGQSKQIFGWDVTATPVICGELVYWLGMFDDQQISHRFESAEDIFAHVRNCLIINTHPCKTAPYRSPK